MLSNQEKTNTINDLKLNDFQKWVLFYFLKNPNTTVTADDLLDNMCLTAIVDLDIDNAEQALEVLSRNNLITHVVPAKKISIKTGEPVEYPTEGKTGYFGTLKGRLYLKQKVILPLVLAKREDKIRDIVAFLSSNYPHNQLVEQLNAVLQEKDQHQFLERLATLALTQLHPILTIMDKIQERFFGNT